MEPIKDVFSILISATSIILGFLLWRRTQIIEAKESRISQLETEAGGKKEQMDKLIDFCRSVMEYEDDARNVVVIGPRGSGKSSIVACWCEIDRLIDSIVPTINFETYEYDLKKDKEEEFDDDKLGISRPRITRQILNIFDYAGEDNQVPNAISRIASSHKCTIVMVFNCDPDYEIENKRYFSRTFIERLNRAFDESEGGASGVAAVHVVFNKFDLLDQSFDEDNSIDKAKAPFNANISHIESTFGGSTNYWLTSAPNNTNVVNLLKSIVINYDSEFDEF